MVEQYDFFSAGLEALAGNKQDGSWTVDWLIAETCMTALASVHPTSDVRITFLPTILCTWRATNRERKKTFCVMLLELAARPEYQSLLRDEIRQVVLGEGVDEGGKDEEKAKAGGWTLASMDRLHKLDSFMRETRRVRPVSDSTVPFTHSTAIYSLLLPLFPHALEPVGQ